MPFAPPLRWMIHSLLVPLLLSATTSASAQEGEASSEEPQTLAGGYPLQPGDQIRLSFEREPELNGEYPIDETGSVVLPLLGRWRVTETPAARLKDTLFVEYDAQLRNQTVQVILLRRVRVLGAVQQAGVYHIDPTMTFGDVVALAGGATRDGKPDKIRILRDGDVIRTDLTTSDPVLTDLRSGDQVMIPERSWLSRNSRWVIGSTISIAAFTLIRVLTN
ncbi:MAG: polysaccharide biosynthesis/export family protein [Gemmatimonadota bacterium]